MAQSGFFYRVDVLKIKISQTVIYYVAASKPCQRNINQIHYRMDSLMKYYGIKDWFKRFQSFQHRVDESNANLHYFTVNYDINMNFSLALQSILAGLIDN